jgi:glc operon protein GlcG
MINIKKINRIVASLLVTSFTFAAGLSEAETLSNAKVRQILASVRQQVTNNKSTGCVAVTDAAGLLLGFERFDEAPPGCVNAAIAKAKTSALYRAPSLKFMQRLQKGEYQVLAIPQAIALGGGYPLKIGQQVVGAVGVSTPQQTLDNEIAEKIAKTISSAASEQ